MVKKKKKGALGALPLHCARAVLEMQFCHLVQEDGGMVFVISSKDIIVGLGSGEYSKAS